MLLDSRYRFFCNELLFSFYSLDLPRLCVAIVCSFLLLGMLFHCINNCDLYIHSTVGEHLFYFPVWGCDIVTYKKYVYSHWDDQNISLIYVWSLFVVPGS